MRVHSISGHEWRIKTYINIFRQQWLPQWVRARLNSLSTSVQYRLHVDRLAKLAAKYPKLGKGSNWCDLTEAAVRRLLAARRSIRRFTRFSRCSDELYKQIVLLNDPDIAPTISSCGTRKIDWTQGGSHPRVYTPADFDELVSAGGRDVFARKFSDVESRECIDRLYEYLQSRAR